ncbi:MAG: SH3 domain-containing protein [Oscillospiraceae bacterium]|nr:SH3 domain-containing protein [Oscillospiraceae bacterium]
MKSVWKRILVLLLLTAITVSVFSAVSLSADASELKTAIGTVKAAALLLRETPSASGRILGTAYRDDKVVVMEQSGDWYHVVYNLKTGYMHKAYLELDTVKNVKLGYARFEYSTNVRQKPSTNSGIVARAPKNDTCFIVGFNRGWYKVSFNGKPGYVRSDLVAMLESPYTNVGSRGNTYHEDSASSGAGSSSETPAPAPVRLGNASMSMYEKYLMIFGKYQGVDHRLVYKTPAEARAHMTNIEIKTWDINAKGEKYTRTWSLPVHERVAPTVQAIFDEIYALPEKVPIHSLGGYRWETKSEHTVGLAVDINPQENGYFSPSGKLLYGKGFHPETDPYAFPVGGSVDQIFAKYGFTRGIYWKSGYKDYMHYSFLGT